MSAWLQGGNMNRAVNTARRLVIVLALSAWPLMAHAADEIQVYNAEINEPGAFSLQLHGNYVFKGSKTPDFPGGVAPNHAFNGTPEFAYGLEDWWEIGAYIPYEIGAGGHAQIGSVKLRSLFVSPHAAESPFFYGLNFEVGYYKATYDPNRYNMEMRPMVGWRGDSLEFVLNPILGLALSGNDHTPEFEPAMRLGYIVSPKWTVAVEHYAGLGPIDHFNSLSQQSHETFLVVDWAGPVAVNFGLGHGWNAASNDFTAKFIIDIGF